LVDIQLWPSVVWQGIRRSSSVSQ